VRIKALVWGLVWVSGSIFGFAQQKADLSFRPIIVKPAYVLDNGPRVGIDEAHHNYHTAEGRYKPFAEGLKADGYRVEAFRERFSAETLRELAVLVIANPLHEKNVGNWSLPNPSAFSTEEIAAVHQWVEGGGSLFLMLDHMPFPGAGDELAKAFGVKFSNGFAVPKKTQQPGSLVFKRDAGGMNSGAVTNGRSEEERVTTVVTFTGSAFLPPKEAVVVLPLGVNFVSLETAKAWSFTPNTPQQGLDGWCQGAVLTCGRGRIAVFGEAAMFTAS